MKYSLLLFSFSLFSLFAISQEIKPDSRLFAKYSEEYLQRILNTNPQSILYHNFSLDNSYKIIDKQLNDKISQLPELYKINKDTKEIIKTSINNLDINNFNLMEYSFERNMNKRVYYRIGNTGYVLELFSEQEVIKAFNNKYHQE